MQLLVCLKKGTLIQLLPFLIQPPLTVIRKGYVIHRIPEHQIRIVKGRCVRLHICAAKGGNRPKYCGQGQKAKRDIFFHKLTPIVRITRMQRSGLTPGRPPHPFPSGPAGSPAAVSEKSPQPPPGNLCPMQGKAHPTCRGYGACG